MPHAGRNTVMVSTRHYGNNRHEQGRGRLKKTKNKVYVLKYIVIFMNVEYDENKDL
jgi:hypothetical protein